MMLDSDMCLLFNNNRDWIECIASVGKENQALCVSFAKSGGSIAATYGECCAWVNTPALFEGGALHVGEENPLCGLTVSDIGRVSDEGKNIKRACCATVGSDSYGDCEAKPTGLASSSVL